MVKAKDHVINVCHSTKMMSMYTEKNIKTFKLNQT